MVNQVEKTTNPTGIGARTLAFPQRRFYLRAVLDSLSRHQRASRRCFPHEVRPDEVKAKITELETGDERQCRQPDRTGLPHYSTPTSSAAVLTMRARQRLACRNYPLHPFTVLQKEITGVIDYVEIRRIFGGPPGETRYVWRYTGGWTHYRSQGYNKTSKQLLHPEKGGQQRARRPDRFSEFRLYPHR